MHPAKELPELVDLQQAFRYEPETGKLYWIERPEDHFLWDYDAQRRWNSYYPGQEAGRICYQTSTKRVAYVCVTGNFFGFHRKMMAHRIILAMHEIPIPKGYVVDHIDGDASNNRLENLRVCTHAQNIMNNPGYRHYRGKPRDLPKGVSRSGKKFMANAHKGGKHFYLGTFDTPEEAHEAWKIKSKELHGEFFRAS